SSLSFLTSSGNGSGTLSATLHFSDGTADVTGLTFSSPDWFNSNPIAITANGRINSGGYDSVDSGNPRLYDETINVPANAAGHPIASMDRSCTGSAGNTHTAIFGVSGAGAGVAQTF